MRHALLFSVAGIALAAMSQPASAQSTTAGKPPEVRTALPPELSPALSASQLAKQAMIVPTAAPVGSAAPVAGVKVAPLTTSLPPDPALAESHAKASAAKLQLTPQQLVQRDLAIAQGRTLAPLQSMSAHGKPADFSTMLPADPATAAARAQALANKLAHERSVASPHTASKPAPVVTNGPAPTTLPLDQVSKRAQATAASPRRQP